MVRPFLKISLALGLIFLVALVGSLFVPTENDERQYQQLMDKAQSSRVTYREKKGYRASQFREGVVKDVFIGGLQAHVVSRDSELVFDQQQGAMEMVEHMHGVVGLIQKELFFVTEDGKEVVSDGEAKYRYRKGGEVEWSRSFRPMQTICVIEAEQASFTYNKEFLALENPTLKEYRINGHSLPENIGKNLLYMEGKAERATVSFAGEHPTLHAERFQVSIHPNGVLP